jgi:hypothetical protein
MHSDRVDAGVVAKDVDTAERFGDGRERGLRGPQPAGCEHQTTNLGVRSSNLFGRAMQSKT